MEPPGPRPGPGSAAAEVVETHISVVVFVGDRAYKLKKPVDLGFLDFSTRERREIACHHEVALNRRLAPDVYLGVLDVVDEQGNAVDHLVEMRRMPAPARLSVLLRTDRPRAERGLRDVARRLAAFHAASPRSPGIDTAATGPAMLDLWDRNRAGLDPFLGSVLPADDVAAADALARTFVAGRDALLEERIAAGRVVDGHGDLLADDIFLLDDGPRILDGIEFDDRLRHGDVVHDVGFLVMDLERMGEPDLASAFFGWYCDDADDHPPGSLLGWHVAYRALVRAKIAALRHAQGRADAAAEGELLCRLARRSLEQDAVRLVLVGGAPGTGKTTLAAALAERNGWSVLSTDLVRKELAGIAPDVSARAPFGEGLYARDERDRVYDVVLDRARSLLAHGRSVVADASWTDGVWRDAAARVAAETHSSFVALECVLDPELAAARLAARAPTDAGGSDADADIARRLGAARSAWPGATPIDTERPRDEVVAEAASVASRPAPPPAPPPSGQDRGVRA